MTSGADRSIAQQRRAGVAYVVRVAKYLGLGDREPDVRTATSAASRGSVGWYVGRALGAAGVLFLQPWNRDDARKDVEQDVCGALAAHNFFAVDLATTARLVNAVRAEFRRGPP